MTALIGTNALSLAVLLAGVTLFAAIASARFDSAAFLRAARWALAAMTLAFTVAAAALFTAMLTCDLRIAYVTHYTERALPAGYKLAAFWAGQEGSLLLWGWILAVMSLIAVWSHRHPGDSFRGRGYHAATVASLAVVCGFFAALLLFAADPFALSPVVPADGRGLNPMLQDPGMIAHPPILFLGYAGFTIPFAFLVGALFAKRTDNLWLADIRRWTIVSWLFLSVGIILGAQWAYVELGWGGYWAWDPVENASLLPWLTGTALMHSATVQQRRGMFKRFNAFLIAVTFILCIFGTYLTRSGIVESVHTFGQSLVGTFFFVFLCILTAASTAIITWRRRVLRSEAALDGLFTREGVFLMGNVLLVAMTAATLVGTIFPVLSGIFGQPVTVGSPFYNKVVLPMALLLVAFMAMGPLLTHGKDAAKTLVRGLIIPAIFAALAVAYVLAHGITNAWSLSAAAVSAVAVSAIVLDLVRTLKTRVQSTGEHYASALVRLLDQHHHRYGGQIAHVGVILMVIGVVGSSLFNNAKDDAIKLGPGQSTVVREHTVKLESLTQVDGPNYTAVRATLSVYTPAGETITLTPERRQYHKYDDQLNSEVAIHSTWRQDFYATLAGWEDGGQIVAIQAIVNPMVSWIWTGGLVLAIGSILCVLPRFLKDPVKAQNASPLSPRERAGVRAPATESLETA